MQFWFELLRSSIKRDLPEDRISGTHSGNRKVNWKLLKPYFVRHLKWEIFGGLVILITTLLAFPTPLLTRFLVDKVILGKQLDWLIWAILGIAGIKLLSMLAGMIEQYIFSRLQMDVSVELQEDLLGHTLQLPKSFFDDKEVGYLMSRIVSDVQGLSWFFSQTIVYFFTNIIRFIGGIIFLLILEWRLALVTLVVLPLLVFSVNAFSRRMRILSHHSMEQHANVYTRFEETLASIPLIKSFVSEEQESQRVIKEVKTAQRISLEQTIIGSVANSLFNLIPDIAKAIVLVAGAYWVIKDQWTLGSLLAFQSYLGFVYGPALSIAGINMDLQSALTSLDRVSALLDVVPENSAGEKKQVAHLKGGVRFENVTFSYDNLETVLEDVSFDVEPGEHVAFVGASGVGKTTLISLLLRFYNPSQGKIFYDDLQATEYDLPSLRQRIGYVSQSTLLLSGTIRDNLIYGNPGVSNLELERAVKVAGIHDFIMGQPGQYDAVIGERGVNLSEGQKQRLAIARALIKDPDILILDEPTASLDVLVESSIFDALPTEIKGKTLFIATHHLSTIQRAGKIIVLKDKHVSGIGTHQELVETDPYYSLLVSKT